MDRRGKVGEEAPRGGKGVCFALDDIVDRAVLPLDLPAAEFLLGDILAQCDRDRRPGYKDLAEFLDHDREMACRQPAGAHPGAGAERQGDERNL